MAESTATSPHVKSLRLVYMKVDGVNELKTHQDSKYGDKGHEELILGPHSIDELADGLNASKEWFQHSLTACASMPDKVKRKYKNQEVAPLAEVLKTFKPSNPSYRMSAMDSHAETDGLFRGAAVGVRACQWYVRCANAASIDTQVTYTVPLAKLTSDEFVKMPRSGSQISLVENSRKAALALLNDAKLAPVKADPEIQGFFQLFYSFTMTHAQCKAAGASCIKNADGQMAKVALRSLYSTLTQGDPSLAKKRRREALVAWWKEGSAKPPQKTWFEPTETLLTRVLGAFPGEKPPDAKSTFKHHLTLLFDGSANYKNHCAQTLRKDVASCDELQVAVEAFPAINNHNNLAYIIVEGRFTANSFNRAFFPCGKSVNGTGCTGPIDFTKALIDLPPAKLAEWERLDRLQTPPPVAQVFPPPPRAQPGSMRTVGVRK